LRSARGTCGACIKRCPVQSIGQSVHERNKDACHKHAYQFISQRGRELFGWEGVYGCGLCQSGVPCEACDPTASM
jgi:epoxyqueuosine reductase QueG